MKKRRPMKIVERVEDYMDPEEILCTTYQMRSIYKQFGTAFINSLDVMNYIQHHKAALLCKKGDRVLDVCCGRGLILPLLRWFRKDILLYVGVDISETNSSEIKRWAGIREISNLKLAPNCEGDGEPYYPFEVHLIHENVAEMSFALEATDLAPFHKIMYMASIEHMQRDAGVASLQQCYRVLRPKGVMFLSSPNTTDKANPYDTQYRAHLYEWPREELLEVAKESGFVLEQEVGLVAKVRGYKEKLQQFYPEHVDVFEEFEKYLPSAWLYSLFPIITPQIADEVAFIMRKP